MTKTFADRNLLLGILALQMDFISRDALLDAMQAWVFDKTKSLGQILLDRHALGAETHALLEALVLKHLEQHDHDAEKSLAALGSLGPVREELQQIADAELEASLACVPATRKGDDPYPTRVESVGMATSAGLRFHILRPHARGGLGEVFVAEDGELHREVALKQIQERHADNPESRARFLVEAEITGGLEHPGVVPVYGLGQYADGRPFYAMRLIRGDSLKEAIERFHQPKTPGPDPGERALALRKLLGRFIDVCNAMAYAHARGVIHRDLKPGNIMLGPYGETLVVDWGLAKPVGRAETARGGKEEVTLKPSSGSSYVATQAGSAIGTPAYMSPEQAAGRLDEIGPASDIYSLGATLYTLLTGKSAFAETDAGSVLQRVEKGAFLRPREVRREVPPALEAVCLKAMALHAEDRYASPRVLADDVEHWLGDEAVMAYREPAPARWRRWGRKHPGLVSGGLALAGTGAVALMIGLFLLQSESRRTARANTALAAANVQLEDTNQELHTTNSALEIEKRNADAARQAESRRRKQARQALDDLSSQIVDDWLSKQQELSADHKAFLEKALRSYEEFAGDAGQDEDARLGVAQANRRLGMIQSRLGRDKDAEVSLRRSQELSAQLAAEFSDRPEFRANLARSQSALAMLLLKTGRAKDSESALRGALSIQKELATGFPRRSEFRADLAMSQNLLGSLLNDRSQVAAAETILQDTLAIQKRLVADFPENPDFRKELAAIQLNLGSLAWTKNLVSDAEAAFHEAITLLEQLTADFPTRSDLRYDLARDRSNLGALMAWSNRNAEAERMVRAAVVLLKRLAADFPARPDFRFELARSQIDLGTLLARTDRKAESEAAYRDAVALQRALKDDFPERADFSASLASSLSHQAHLSAERGEMAAARGLREEALALYQGLLQINPNNTEWQAGFRYAVKVLRKQPFTVGPETTYVTGPLDRDGTIDYAAAMEQRLSQGVTPAKNAGVLLCQALGPRPDGARLPQDFYRSLGMEEPAEQGDYFIPLHKYVADTLRIVPGKKADEFSKQLERARQRPWTPAQYPELAAWLKANDKPLALATEATKRPQYFVPFVMRRSKAGMASGLITAQLPTTQACRGFGNALAARAMLSTAQRGYNDAWQDVLACHRLAVLVGRGGTLIDNLVGFAFDRLAYDAELAFLNDILPDARRVEGCLRDLQSLAPLPAVADTLLYDRFIALDSVLQVDGHGLIYLGWTPGSQVGDETSLKLFAAADRFLEDIDWDPALRKVNGWYDRLEAGARIQDRVSKETAWDAIDREREALRQRLNDPKLAVGVYGWKGIAVGILGRNAKTKADRLNDFSKWLEKQPAEAKGKLFGDIIVGLTAPDVRKVTGAADRAEQVRQNARLAFALAWYRQDCGRYPETLEALAPKYLPQIPKDVFSGRPLIYRPSENGYLLYSVGANGKDDGGRSYDDEPPADDLSVRMPLPALRRK